jgi:hypothetical protein
MGSTRALDADVANGSALTRAASEHLELEQFRDENRQLRELVIQLSKLVLRNVVERT